MNIEEYKREFRKKAEIENYSAQETDKMLNYALELYKKNLPIIFDSIHFSLLVGVKQEYLYKVSNSQYLFYRTFYIPKKNKEQREIKEPLPILKDIQSWILDNILNNVPVSIYSKAFKKDSSIKDNARFHQNQNIVVCLDIEKYFNNIKEYDVIKMFSDLGYNKKLSVLLAKLCCLDNSLPQGAPTSPYISNIITKNMDCELAGLAKELSNENFSIRYTRYADDITFSGSEINISDLIGSTRKILKKYQFKLNDKKTRVFHKNNRQLVTGIVVNEKMQVSKNLRKQLRANVYFIKKFGLANHMAHQNINISEKQYLRQLLGNINFVLFVNPRDQEFIEYKNYINGEYKTTISI